MAKLTLSIYKPALNRKDVRLKVELALEQFLQFYRSQEERTLSVPQLEEWFGKHQNALYKWLRANLLTEVRSYSVIKARAITYQVSQRGFDKTWALLHGQSFEYKTERARQVEPLFRPFLASDDPAGLALPKIEGGRLYWGAAQTVEKEVRAIILKGNYDYDIQAAMPTLVLQSIAAREGLDWREAFPAWARYLGNRAAYRESLAQRLNITAKQAKAIFQGLFDLRKFNLGQRGIVEIIGREKTKKAKEDPILKALADEAFDAWSRLGLQNDGNARFQYYEREEQKVMSVIYEAARTGGIRFLPFHDGLTLLDGRRIADLDGLRALIFEKTGYDVLIEEKLFN